jgi:RNA polymerase sigma factor (sigma-70 family)
VEENLMNRSGSRAGRKVHDDIFDDGGLDEDEGENCFLKRLFRQPQYMAENPEDNFIRKETVREILSSMTKKQRKAVILHCVYGYTEKETAGKLGITQPAVSALLKNAEQIAKEIV